MNSSLKKYLICFYVICTMAVISAQNCDNITFAPSYEMIVQNSIETLNQINKGNSCTTHSRACEPNNTGSCYANAAIEAYSNLDTAAHPIYAALLYSTRHKRDEEQPVFAGGFTCHAFHELTKEAKICDHDVFNKYFKLSVYQPLDLIVNSLKLNLSQSAQNTLTTPVVIKSLIESLLFDAENVKNEKSSKEFESIFVTKSKAEYFNQKKLDAFIDQYTPSIKIDMLKLLLESKNFEILKNKIYKSIKDHGNDLKNVDLQLSFMNTLCESIGAMKANPLFQADLDYVSNYIGDDYAEADIIHRFFDLKKNTPLGKRYPDYITIHLHRFLDPNSSSLGTHAFTVLGQRWDEASRRCQLVFKDSNNHANSNSCQSVLDQQGNKKLEAIYDESNMSCYYYFPKYELLTAANNLIRQYCFIGTKQDVQTFK